MKYDAFISYSHSDCGTIAPAIQKAIENIGKPWYQLKRNLNVFRDETNLGANPHLWENIEAALGNSGNFILLASPKTSDSTWIPKEIEKWREKDPTFQRFNIVVTSGKIDWDINNKDFDWDKTTCLPTCLKGKFQAEPLYINLSEYVNKNKKPIDYKSPGFTYKIVKVISGITGVLPREILSDELKRNRIIKYILGITTVFFIILSFFAFTMWQNATEQKKIAIIEKEKAETSEKKAVENLRKFKIEEFNKNLRNGKIYIEADEKNFAKQVFIKADSTAKDTLYSNEISSKDKKYLDSIIKIIKSQ